ncbi:MAG: hypothetical protein Q9160_005156 [Pyrenula sp. 1 TL-2023]
MATKGSVYSQTLQDITNTKLTELAKKRKTFEERHENIKALVHQENDGFKALESLADAVKTCFSILTADGRVVRGATGNVRLEIDLRNLDRFLAQARYDPSVSTGVLEQWQRSMLRHLQVQSMKFAYASLYGELTTEWLSAKRVPPPAPKGEDTEMDDFEHVSGGKKLESRSSWEKSVFGFTPVDKEAITSMLHDLFEATPDDSKHLLQALKRLRQKAAAFEGELTGPDGFTSVSLRWTIKGLLASDLLNDEKREVLRDFLSNEVILIELADVLNMRMAALQDWSWGDEVPLEERRQLNGSYNIYMHEDLLQAIFLQYIGVRWSVFWKSALSDFKRTKGVWKSTQSSIPNADKIRRRFYLGSTSVQPTVDSKKQAIYHQDYFLAQLLRSPTQESSMEEGEQEANFEQMRTIQQPQQPSQQMRALRAPAQGYMRQQSGRAYGRGPAEDEFELASGSDEGDEEGDESNKPKNPMTLKQNLLHMLSADILLKTRLRGELTCFRSQIDNLFPSLPHSTLVFLLSYFGVSMKWLEFFKRFLRAPLRFMDDPGSEPRQRKTGTPGSHVLSEVFGEIVLFCLDFGINQKTGGEILWRMQDDFWFWSPSRDVCIKAWSTVQEITSTMGLNLNVSRTGAVRMTRKAKTANDVVSVDVGDKLPSGQIRWGMLFLNPTSGRFEIDQQMVDKHITELSRQLKDKTDSIFSYIQAWNTYAATFFTSNFGKPANCFGRRHVDDMLATHQRIQRQIFSSSTGSDPDNQVIATTGSVIEFLKQAISQRFHVHDIPDGYFFFPTELGGLEVRSPFIGLLQIRDGVVESPDRLLDDFVEAELAAYTALKKAWDTDSRPSHFEHDKHVMRAVDPDSFFSFEEYTKYREQLTPGWYSAPNLHDVYTRLLKKPEQESIETEDNGIVKTALNGLGRQSGLKGILANWAQMEPYWKWVAQLYGPEMIERLGGLSIVDPGLLPMGMVSLFKGGRVKWQE